MKYLVKKNYENTSVKYNAKLLITKNISMY